MYKLSNGRILYRGRDLEEFNKAPPCWTITRACRWCGRIVRFIEPTHTIYHHRPPPLLHSKVSDKPDLPDMVYGLLERWGSPPPKPPRPSTRTSSPAASARVNIARNLAGRRKCGGGRTHLHARRSIRIGILNLMEQMKNELGVSMLYITHDIATARYVAGRSGGDVRGSHGGVGRGGRDPAPPPAPLRPVAHLGGADPEKSIHAELEGGRKGKSRSGPRIPWLSLCRALPSQAMPRCKGEPAAGDPARRQPLRACYLHEQGVLGPRRAPSPGHASPVGAARPHESSPPAASLRVRQQWNF